MDVLRVQCPWDKKQTMESLRYLTMRNCMNFLMQFEQGYGRNKKRTWRYFITCGFLCLASEKTNDFDILDVINNLCDKLNTQTSPYMKIGIQPRQTKRK